MQCFAEIKDIPAELLEANHGGLGPIHFRRLLTGLDFLAPVDFVDFTVIPPGSTIGRHEHHGSDEVYFVASGAPLIKVGNEQRRVERGGISVVHSGQSHQLVNDTPHDVEIFVIQVRLPDTQAAMTEPTDGPR
jgi:glyoxylate utilization-related uncharacterized protein